MKILAICPTAGLSGVDQTFSYLCLGLVEAGINVTAVLPPDAAIKGDLLAADVDVNEVEHMHWWFPPAFSDDDVVCAIDRSRANVQLLLSMILEIRPDLVISNTSVFLDGAMAAMISGTPHLTHLHALFVDNIYTQMSQNFKSAIYGLLAGPGASMVVPAAATKRELVQLVPEVESHVYAIPNGVDLEKFVPPESAQKSKVIRILSLGHFNANKNQIILVDVARELKRRGIDNFIFILAGPPEEQYLSSIRNKIEESDLSNYFKILEPQTNVVPLLQSAHIYTNCSITETFPVSVLEAMATGLPVICTPTVGAMEIVAKNSTGLIGADINELANHFAMLILDEKTRQTMGQAARKRVVDLYSSQLFIKNFIDVIKLTIAFGKPKPLPWLEPLFFRKPLLGNAIEGVRIAVVVPDRSQTSFELLIRKPFNYIQKTHLHIIPSIYSYGELGGINFDEVDVLYVFRVYADPIPSLVDKAKAMNIPVIFETDDNYFALMFEGGSPIHKAVKNPALESILAEADSVIVYSKKMEDDAAKFSRKVNRLRPYQLVDDRLVRECSGLTVGFMGSLKKDVDFEVVTPALQRLLDERVDLRIEFFGFVPEALQEHPRVLQESFDPNYDDFIQLFRQRNWTVGLAPLADTEFNRSKTNNKYREYAAAGYAGVYSKVAPYADCVVDGENGLLVNNTSDDWYHAISKLLNNEQLRSYIANNAFIDVKKNYRFIDHVRSKIEILQALNVPKRHKEVAIQKTWVPKQSLSGFSRAVDVSASRYHPIVVRNYKGMLSAIELVVLDFVYSSQTSLGVEVVYEEKIVAHIIHLASSIRPNAVARFNLPSPILIDGPVEIRVFSRSPVGKAKVMGKFNIARRCWMPLLALVGVPFGTA